MEIKEILVVFAEIGVIFLISSKYVDTKFKEVEDRISAVDIKYDKRCDEQEAYVRRVEAVSEVNRKSNSVVQVVIKDESTILSNTRKRSQGNTDV